MFRIIHVSEVEDVKAGAKGFPELKVLHFQVGVFYPTYEQSECKKYKTN